MNGVISYIVQQGETLYLCVIDDAKGEFHRFEINPKGLARLASESAWAVNAALGGFNPPLLKIQPSTAQREIPK